jgi:hypothetical protein
MKLFQDAAEFVVSPAEILILYKTANLRIRHPRAKCWNRNY